jgi:hypothetical protein
VVAGVPEPQEEWLGLADAIALLRDQVADARRRIASGPDGDRGVLFALGDVTLELGVELTRARGAGGALTFGVVGLNAKKDSADKATHKVTVQLTPRLPGGGGVDVGDVE